MSQVASPEPTSDALAEQFISVSHVVRQRANTQMSAAGLSLARTRALKALVGADRMRMNELSAALGVVPRTVTTLVDSLEKEGFVERAPDPHDRRVTTQAGTNSSTSSPPDSPAPQRCSTSSRQPSAVNSRISWRVSRPPPTKRATDPPPPVISGRPPSRGFGWGS
jgi:hypothetical protein